MTFLIQQTLIFAIPLMIVLTVLLEIAVAWLFRLRAKGQLRLILGVNIVTQLLLNGFLNWYSYVNGTLFLTAFFLLGDLVEYDGTEKMFEQPQDKRTEDYITGRFG